MTANITYKSKLFIKDSSNDISLVDEANDSHFAGALRADKRICFIDLVDKVGRLRVATGAGADLAALGLELATF